MRSLSGTLLALLIAGAILFQVYENLSTFSNGKTGHTDIAVPRGATLKDVSKLLLDEGLIFSSLFFELHTRIEGAASEIKAGDYSISNDSSSADILKVLRKGEEKLFAVTIPEGFSLKQIAERLEAKNFVDANEFIALAKKEEILSTYGIKAVSLEGFLFPDTYRLPKNIRAEKIVSSMVQMFFERINGNIPDEITNDFKKLNELVTLASLIEKETANSGERTLVSSVFHNRLRKGMLLQCDPTVIYSLPNFDGNIRRKDLRYDSPYNTYVYKGLPPGPIANPGLASLKAALNPAKTDYLYFVAKDSTSHYFSKTLAEHNRAVRKYQLRGG